jgi:hypothetical protein
VFTAARQFNLTDVVDQISTPLLITDPEGEQFWPGQPQQLFDELRGASDSFRSLLLRAPIAIASPWHDHF